MNDAPFFDLGEVSRIAKIRDARTSGCKTCIFRQRDTENGEHASASDPDSYECRLGCPQATSFLIPSVKHPTMAPHPVNNPVEMKVGGHACWPKVHKNDWCGQYLRDPDATTKH
jgi:hypothetical protein